MCAIIRSFFYVDFLLIALNHTPANLKSLVFGFGWDSAFGDTYRHLAISQFVNLIWLTLNPMSYLVHEKLLSSRLPSLRAFVTSLYHEGDIHLHHFADLLDSEIFSRLRILGLIVEPCCKRSRQYEFAWTRITHSNIASQLKYLELTFGLVSIWLQDINKLSRLKALYWKVAAEECVISVDSQAKFFWDDGIVEEEDLWNGKWDTVTGDMLVHEATKYCRVGYAPSLNFYVGRPEDYYELCFSSMFELEESGFDEDRFDAAKKFIS